MTLGPEDLEEMHRALVFAQRVLAHRNESSPALTAR